MFRPSQPLIDLGDARVGTAAGGAAALVGAQVIGKSLRDTLFLGSFGVEQLPVAMVIAALASGALVLGLARASAKYSPRGVAVVSLATSVGLLLCAWGVAHASPHAAAALTYFQSAALSAAGVSIFWSLISETFDPHTARSAVPRIMAGATLGGLVGGVLAWRAAPYVRAHDLLLVVVVLNLAAIPAALRLRGARSRERLSTQTAWRRLAPELPYLRAVGAVVLLAAATQALLDYLLADAASLSFDDEHELLAFFAVFQSSVGVASFLLQIGVSRSVLERFSPGFVLSAPPLLLLLVSGAFPLVPILVAAVVMRGVDGALGASLHRSAYELLFTPIDPATKREAKPVLDVGIDRLGTFLGSVTVMAVVTVAGNRAAIGLVVLVAALAASRAWLSLALHGGYRRALAKELSSGRLDLSRAGFMDPGTLLTLSRGLGESDRDRLMAEVGRLRAAKAERTGGGPNPALSMAGFDLPPPAIASADSAAEPHGAGDGVVEDLMALRSGDEGAARAVLQARKTEPILCPQVLVLLADDRLARDAADWLSVQEPPPIGLLADALLDDRLPDAARRRVARLLAKHDDDRARNALLDSFVRVPTLVRVGVGEALAHASADRPLPQEPIFEALERVAAEPRAVSEVEQLEEIFHLLAAAFPKEPIDAALRALRRGGRARGTALEWLDVLLPRDVKSALWPRLVRSGETTTLELREAGELRQAVLEADRKDATGPVNEGGAVYSVRD